MSDTTSDIDDTRVLLERVPLPDRVVWYRQDIDGGSIAATFWLDGEFDLMAEAECAWLEHLCNHPGPVTVRDPDWIGYEQAANRDSPEVTLLTYLCEEAGRHGYSFARGIAVLQAS